MCPTWALTLILVRSKLRKTKSWFQRILSLSYFVIRSHSIRTYSWLAAIAGKVCSLVGLGGKTHPFQFIRKENLFNQRICVSERPTQSLPYNKCGRGVGVSDMGFYTKGRLSRDQMPLSRRPGDVRLSDQIGSVLIQNKRQSTFMDRNKFTQC